MKKETNTKDLVEIIIEAIKEEPYFTKEVLIPKIKTLITMFRMRTSSANYEKVYDEKGTARLIRSNEIHNLEKDFWKQHLKKIVGDDKIKEYYILLDSERKKWSNENEIVA